LRAREIHPRAGGVASSTPPDQGGGGGAGPTPALHACDVRIAVIPQAAARALTERWHYLGTMPAGTKLALGAFLADRLIGAVTFGVGPMSGHRLLRDARPQDGITLTRFVLLPERPANSASRILGIVLRMLRRQTDKKFVLTYADPEHGHHGGIYQACNFICVGPSEPQPALDLGDGVPRHSRSVASAFGTHSREHFVRHGLAVRAVPVAPKHTYVWVVPEWRDRLLLAPQPYPKRGDPA